MRSLLCLLLLASLSFGAERYIVTLEIKQSHFTLDVFQHAKDAANAIKIEVPVDKQFYDQVAVGTVLNGSFRTASLLLSGSFGNWNVSIVGKRKAMAAEQGKSPVNSR
jgi:hypothetical protein